MNDLCDSLERKRAGGHGKGVKSEGAYMPCFKHEIGTHARLSPSLDKAERRAVVSSTD
jgi:hypothetical protein